MAMSPFRYEDQRRGAAGRSRTGLAGVGTGNGGAAPYQLAALQPGMRGFWASGFGAAPTGATPDRTPDAPPAAPQAPLAGPAQPAQGGRMDLARTGGDGGEGATADGVVAGEPGNLGSFGDLGLNSTTVGGLLGGALGGLAFGPIGGIAGALGGRAIGSAFDGSSGSTGGGGGGGGDYGHAQSDTTSGVTADASPGGNMMGFGTFAEGGPVPLQPTEEIPMQQHGKKKKGGLHSVGKGQGQGYMGGYAEGGRVLPLTDMDAVRQEAYHHVRPRDIFPRTASGAYDPRIEMNNVLAGGSAKALERVPGPVGPHDTEMMRLLASRPDLLQAIIQQQGSVHPPAANNPSTGTGYMGAFAQGGHVGMPNYAEGGTVDALAGPNPPGPDDGFAALDGGEFVVRASQAQRPDYAPVLEQMNQGTYAPGADDMGGGSNISGDPIYTYGASTQDATTTSHVSALDGGERAVLLEVMQSSPEVQAALTALLGPEGMAMLQATPRAADAVDARSVMAARAPLSGPPPMPGTASPPGYPPPAQRRGGIGSVGSGY